MLTGGPVTIDAVKGELVTLDECYKAKRAGLLRALHEPYARHRKRLVRLLDVLESESAPGPQTKPAEETKLT